MENRPQRIANKVNIKRYVAQISSSWCRHDTNDLAIIRVGIAERGINMNRQKMPAFFYWKVPGCCSISLEHRQKAGDAMPSVCTLGL